MTERRKFVPIRETVPEFDPATNEPNYNWTKTSNRLIDDLYPSKVSGSLMLAIILHVARETWGSAKQTMQMSRSQACKRWNCSRQAFATAVDDACSRGIIERIKGPSGPGGGTGTNLFRMGRWIDSGGAVLIPDYVSPKPTPAPTVVPAQPRRAFQLILFPGKRSRFTMRIGDTDHKVECCNNLRQPAMLTGEIGPDGTIFFDAQEPERKKQNGGASALAPPQEKPSQLGAEELKQPGDASNPAPRPSGVGRVETKEKQPPPSGLGGHSEDPCVRSDASPPRKPPQKRIKFHPAYASLDPARVDAFVPIINELRTTELQAVPVDPSDPEDQPYLANILTEAGPGITPAFFKARALLVIAELRRKEKPISTGILIYAAKEAAKAFASAPPVPTYSWREWNDVMDSYARAKKPLPDGWFDAYIECMRVEKPDAYELYQREQRGRS